MKYKTTTKAVKEGYRHIISVGYCALQNLLRGEYPVAYTAGVYGWNYDVYEIDGVAICTGYRGMPYSNIIKYRNDLISKYDGLASEIHGWDQGAKEKRWDLLNEFINECIKKQ